MSVWLALQWLCRNMTFSKFSKDLEWTRPELWLKSEKRPEKQNVANHPTFGLFWRFLPAATQNKTPGINTYFPTEVSVWILVVFCFFKWNLRSSPSFFTHQTEPVESQRGGVRKTDELLIIVTVKYSAHLFFNPVSPETPSSQLALGGWLLSIALQLCSKADTLMNFRNMYYCLFSP